MLVSQSINLFVYLFIYLVTCLSKNMPNISKSAYTSPCTKWTQSQLSLSHVHKFSCTYLIYTNQVFLISYTQIQLFLSRVHNLSWAYLIFITSAALISCTESQLYLSRVYNLGNIGRVGRFRRSESILIPRLHKLGMKIHSTRNERYCRRTCEIANEYQRGIISSNTFTDF